MALKVDEGFLQAKSDNLPRIDMFMVAEFFRNNDCFTASELRGVKEKSAGRESYGDAAVGYVQLKRDTDICVVKCRICPEHRVKARSYTVVIEVDEASSKVVRAQCLDCAASAGGCKHAVAFLMWLHRRSEEPAPTEIKCYWKKSKLSQVGTSLKFLTVEAFGAKPVEQPQNNFLQDFLNQASQSVQRDQVLQLFKTPKFASLSIYNLLLKFVEQNRGDSYKKFVEFARQEMHDDLCQEASACTLSQAEESTWHQLRFGRITASKLYTAAHCKKENGSFVQQVIGVAKLRDTEAMKRGRILESSVLETLETDLGKKLTPVGIMLSKRNPIFGASPDALYKDHVVEVKCPSSAATVCNYITADNEITAKYKAQVQLQMHILQKRRCIFAVADPDFVVNKKVTTILVTYDEKYVTKVMADAELFWEKCIFPILLTSAKK